MKIGIDARPLTAKRAGIGTYVYNVVKTLNETDDSNEYYLFSCKEVVIDFPLKSNWHIVVEPFKVGTLWLAVKGGALVKKYGIDVFWGTQHVLPNQKPGNVKYVLTICDLAQFRIKNIGSVYNTLIQKFFVKGSCKRADKILAISEATKFDIVDIFGIEAARIKCIYLGGVKEPPVITEEVRRSTLDKFNIKNPYFLFVSTIEPRKNVETIIKAYEELRTNCNEVYDLVLVGGLGWKYEGVLELIKNSRYKDNIIMTGFVSQEEKTSLFEACESFVYPSLYEGFGIPLLEAMNYGLPIITANVSSLPEVGGDACAYLSDVKDYHELCSLMKETLNYSDDEKAEIRNKCDKQRAKFSWEKCAKETCAELINI